MTDHSLSLIRNWRNSRRRLALIPVTMLLVMSLPSRAENKFIHHNLVSDLPGVADVFDDKLVSPWGIASSSMSPFWIANNHTGTATVYDENGKAAPLMVTVRSAPGGNVNSLTGQVSNGTSAFVIGGEKPALFLFATEERTISGWYKGVPKNEAIVGVDRSAAGAIYKGVALGKPDSGPVLYAANFYAGTVDVFQRTFHRRARLLPIPQCLRDLHHSTYMWMVAGYTWPTATLATHCS